MGYNEWRMMMNKKVIMITKQGYVWSIDMEAVADNRATYYADDPDSSYEQEYEFTYNDSGEAIDWYQNNMNWSDIPDDKKRLVTIPDKPESPDDIDDDDTEIEIVDVSE